MLEPSLLPELKLTAEGVIFASAGLKPSLKLDLRTTKGCSVEANLLMDIDTTENGGLELSFIHFKKSLGPWSQKIMRSARLKGPTCLVKRLDSWKSESPNTSPKLGDGGKTHYVNNGDFDRLPSSSSSKKLLSTPDGGDNPDEKSTVVESCQNGGQLIVDSLFKEPFCQCVHPFTGRHCEHVGFEVDASLPSSLQLSSECHGECIELSALGLATCHGVADMHSTCFSGISGNASTLQDKRREALALEDHINKTLEQASDRGYICRESLRRYLCQQAFPLCTSSGRVAKMHYQHCGASLHSCGVNEDDAETLCRGGSFGSHAVILSERASLALDLSSSSHLLDFIERQSPESDDDDLIAKTVISSPAKQREGLAPDLTTHVWGHMLGPQMFYSTVLDHLSSRNGGAKEDDDESYHESKFLKGSPLLRAHSTSTAKGMKCISTANWAEKMNGESQICSARAKDRHLLYHPLHYDSSAKIDRLIIRAVTVCLELWPVVNRTKRL